MRDLRVLLSAFIEEWEAGLRPDAGAFLSAAPAPRRYELAEALDAFLSDAPPPRYDEGTLAELDSSQPVREAARALDGRAGTWPLLLPALRRQRRLTRAEAAKRLASELGFPGAHDRVRQHLHDMEYGTADARRVSLRVLSALARVLGTASSDLARAGRAVTLGGPTTGLPPARRGFPASPPFSEVPVDYRQPQSFDPPEWTEIDRLFLGTQP